MTGRRGRILIVEDDETLREILAEVMIDEGHEVRVAANGQEGLESLGSWTPDVVLLDLMMPLMDAFELREQQRRRGVGVSARIVVLSAARDLDAAAERLAADAWLAKPFSLADVSATVQRMLADRSDEPTAENAPGAW